MSVLRNIKTVLSALLIMLMVSLYGFDRKKKNMPVESITEYHIKGYAQGTTYNITFFSHARYITKDHIDSILSNIDSSLSIYKPYSLISKFNQSDSGIVMDRHLKKIIAASLLLNKESSGISDITVYPLMELWKFGPHPATKDPDSSDVKRTLRCIGSDKLKINGDKLIKEIACLKIDVNGIAQGYSVDVVADFLESRGIENYLVEIGGEIRVKGKRQPGNTTLHVGIETPAINKNDEPSVKLVLDIGNGAITTSGNYRKYYSSGGRSISHLMDPKNGYPFQNELISVTVLAPDAITADGYDNVLMGLGLKKGFQFLKSHEKLEAYFIYRKHDGNIADTATQGFYKFIRNMNPPSYD